MKLYGSTTSPFVRRVRIVAQELAVTYLLVDTMKDEGQAQMRTLNPLWKVPTVELGEQTLFDSHVIIETLLAKHGHGGLRPLKTVEERNILTVIDGAVESAINRFYFLREGADPRLPYLVKQAERVHSAMQWLAVRIDNEGAFLPGFGLSEIALLTTLDWMRFRQMYDVDQLSALTRFSQIHEHRPSVSCTLPTLS